MTTRTKWRTFMDSWGFVKVSMSLRHETQQQHLCLFITSNHCVDWRLFDLWPWVQMNADATVLLRYHSHLEKDPVCWWSRKQSANTKHCSAETTSGSTSCLTPHTGVMWPGPTDVDSAEAADGGVCCRNNFLLPTHWQLDFYINPWTGAAALTGRPEFFFFLFSVGVFPRPARAEPVPCRAVPCCAALSWASFSISARR